MSTNGIAVFIKGQNYFETDAGIIPDKATKCSIISRPENLEKNSFVWDEKLVFEMKDIKRQGIDMHLWEKRLTPNYFIGSFNLPLKDYFNDPLVECISDLTVKIEQSEVNVILHYFPNEDEIKRLNKEKEEKEKSRKAFVSTEYEWLF